VKNIKYLANVTNFLKNARAQASLKFCSWTRAMIAVKNLLDYVNAILNKRQIKNHTHFEYIYAYPL